jgi:TRAP-type uncharacterized transport system substrate-binding protein
MMSRLRSLFPSGPPVRLISGILAVLVIGVCLRWVVKGPPHRLVIATDAPNGAFTQIARSYVSRLAAQGVTLEIVTTNGGVDNVARLDAEGSTVDVAFVNGGVTNAKQSPNLESLGTVAYDPLWVVYRSSLGDLDGIPKLRGRTIGIGREGSGTQSIARTVLRSCGITSDGVTTLATDDGEAETATRGILTGKLDAAFLMGAPEDPKIRALFGDDRLRVMNVSDAEGLSRNLSFLHALRLPKSTVDLARQQPDRDLSIVASTVTLVARKDVHPALVYLLMSVVDEVHEPPSLLHRENEFPSDKDTDLPLSPQAEAYFRSGKPFLQRYLPFGLASATERLLKVAVPILLVVLPFVRALPAFNQWRVKRRLALIYRQLLDVERTASDGRGAEGAGGYEAQLRALEERLQAANIPLMYSNELYVLREHIELARKQLASQARTRERAEADPGSS